VKRARVLHGTGWVWLTVLALAAGGCDFATTAKDEATVPVPTGPSAHAQLSVFVLPNPVLVLRDPRDPTSRVARWTVQIMERGGVGGSLSFVNATLRDTDTGAPVEPHGFLSMDAAEIRRLTGTDRLAAGGTLVLAQSLAYASEGSGATLAVAVQLLDDNGNLVSGAVTAAVQ
jgi:hypothetical protein